MEHVFKGYKVGAVDYLRKPVDPHAVRAKVAVFVELYRQRKQLESQSEQLRSAELQLRRRAEASLQESEALYQHTFEEAPVGIAQATPSGRFTRVNQRLANILECSADWLIGRQLESIGEADEQAAIAERLARLQSGQSLSAGEHRLATARKSPIWATLTLSALRRGSALRQLIVVVEDISDRKRHELERENFLAVAAHELKTPLTPLRLQAEGLVRELAQGAEPRHDTLLRRISSIDKAARRIESLVERLLDESQLSGGNVHLEREEIDLCAVIKEAVMRVQSDAAHAGSTIDVQSDGPILGLWDPLRVDQAVTNLLGNAIKYGAGKPIEVKIGFEGGTARFSVRDHGMGIAEGELERIFERFERVAPLRHYSGFGLGLDIVRRVVEAHGGRVTAWSRPHEGSEFVVELPSHLPAGEPVQSPELEMHA